MSRAPGFRQTRKCQNCGKIRSAAQLPKPFGVCRSCQAELSRQNRREAPEAKAEGLRRDRRDHSRAWRIFSEYGLTLEGYESLFAAQKGLCAICKEAMPGEQLLSVDHDHATGDVRGLLCPICNLGLGYFKDSPERLRSAAEYLDRHNR
jgi:ribosomal protein S14